MRRLRSRQAAIRCRRAARIRNRPGFRPPSRRRWCRRPSATCSSRSARLPASARPSGNRRPRGPEAAPRWRSPEGKPGVVEASDSRLGPNMHRPKGRHKYQSSRSSRESRRRAAASAREYEVAFHGSRSVKPATKAVSPNSWAARCPSAGHNTAGRQDAAQGDRARFPANSCRFRDRPRLGTVPAIAASSRASACRNTAVERGAVSLSSSPGSKGFSTDSSSFERNPPATVMDRRGEAARKAAVAQRSRLHR